ncbi:serine hydrolase domain-containing protein [Saccharibacillus alkalitolerans]|uniref:Serine hydrolase n=1 Tax=Saccharibacillus alkalitolerans TaxID=2705290 RepID=A0ABX0F7Q3_9BACL|nr:serine hydrolase [Saccharibacillus alkalitolerans]NGZ76024.1 serine hydrolase [Saccharibacillus alkalitolerans]
MNMNTLPRRRPEEAGVDPQGIIDFLDAAAKEQFDLRSFMLLRRGEVAAEGWWAPHAPEDRHAMYSVSKSFTSTAVGLAVEEGLLAVEDKVADLLPELLPAEPHPNLLKMTVHDLLVMGTGQKEDPLNAVRPVPDSDWARTFLSAPVENVPGTVFSYSSGATYMLSVILQKLTGQKIVDYLEPRLFAPLGIQRKTWQESPQGVTTGGWGLKLSSEDLAKFGQLYLQKGRWNGRRLVPEKWVELASSKRIDNGDNEGGDWTRGYGYQFWMCRHNAYRADGAFGQFCLILPDQEAVVVFTSAISRTQELLEEVWKHLLPAMRDEPLAPGASGEEAAARLRALEYAPEPAGEIPAEEPWSGRTYRLEGEVENGWKPESVRFTADKDSSVLVELSEAANDGSPGKSRITASCGAGKWNLAEAPISGSSLNFAPDIGPAHGWVSRREDGSLRLSIRFAEEPIQLNLKAVFEGGRLELTELGSEELGIKAVTVSGQAENPAN